MKSGASKSKYQVPNLERALKIMEHLAANRGSMPMAEIARALKYPNNSVFRIVSTLEDHGYLVREPESKNYNLSRKMLSLGYQALVESSLTEKALDILRALRDATGETALVGTLLEGEGVVLDQALSNEPIKFMVSPGTRYPLHTAAPAKAILAFVNEEESERQISLIKFTRYNDNTITSADEYRKELKKVRRQGYATDLEEEAYGILCFAAPVFDYRGCPVAAIWITGPGFRIKDKKPSEIGMTVLRHAKQLSSRLGWQEK